MDRRQWIKGLGAAGLLPAVVEGRANASAAKNIIFMVSDGMSAGVLPLAERFSRMVRGRGTVWTELMNRPGAVLGFQDTASLNSPVTDSAAAASAWGSGTRVFNASVNVLPDGTRLVPIAELVRDSRRRVGLVTTATVTHATPAGFGAVQARRDDEQFIAPQYLDRVDVVLGGGARFFDAATRADKRDLAGDYAAKGYSVVRNRTELERAGAAAKVLGLFQPGYMPYVLDHHNSAKLSEAVPTLEEMTRAALKSLAASKEGFLLQVEGGRIDHAAHNNDAAAIVWEQIAFDDALKLVLEFALNRNDTLVVVTTDHGNSNPGLNGMGVEYRTSGACFERLAKARSSFAQLTGRLGSVADYTGGGAAAQTSGSTVADLLREELGLTVSAEEAQTVADAVGRRFSGEPSRQHRNLVGVLGQVAGNHTGVGWTGTQHTSDFAVLTAVGPGAEQYRGLTQNVQAFELMAQTFGIRHRNPRMDPDKARTFAALARPADVHWV